MVWDDGWIDVIWDETQSTEDQDNLRALPSFSGIIMAKKKSLIFQFQFPDM